jgi:hypothetical protein
MTQLASFQTASTKIDPVTSRQPPTFPALSGALGLRSGGNNSGTAIKTMKASRNIPDVKPKNNLVENVWKLELKRMPDIFCVFDDIDYKSSYGEDVAAQHFRIPAEYGIDFPAMKSNAEISQPD